MQGRLENAKMTPDTKRMFILLQSHAACDRDRSVVVDRLPENCSLQSKQLDTTK